MAQPLYQTQVSADWVDYNGHLRDAYYLLIFSYAVDALMDKIGLDSQDRAASGHSLFTLEAHINYLQEVKVNTPVEVRLQVLGHDRKRLHIYLSLYREGDSVPAAVSEQMLLHVELAGPRSAAFGPTSLARIEGVVVAQGEAPTPAYVGRVMGLPG